MQVKLTAESVTIFLKIKEMSGLTFNGVMKQALENLLEQYEQQGVKNDYTNDKTQIFSIKS